MISIDNAVELTIRTYLGLPARVTGIRIGRRRFAEISESFPDMLDALEEHAAEKLTGIDLGEIEWFHRLRNELYHNGNGLTVERAKVEVYGELAKLLWTNLLGGPEEEAPATPPPPDGQPTQTLLLGEFMRGYSALEQQFARLVDAAAAGSPPPSFSPNRLLAILAREGVLDPTFAQKLIELRRIRNELVHGVSSEAEAHLTPELVKDVRTAAAKLGNLANAETGRGNGGATHATETDRDDTERSDSESGD